MAVTFDDFIINIGDLGRFQIRTFILFALAMLPVSFLTYMPLFILTVPEHRCATDNSENGTYSYNASSGRSFYTSHFNDSDHFVNGTGASSCHIVRRLDGTLNNTETYLSSNGFNSMNNSSASLYVEVECEQWVYDKQVFDYTVIEKFNLVCDRKNVRTHVNVAQMCGTLVASFVQGFLSDLFGRKKSVMLFILLIVAVSFAHVFLIVNIPALIAIRFCGGFITMGIYMSFYVAGVELLSPAYRRLFSVGLYLAWVCGGFIFTGMTYFLRDFERLSFAVALSTLPFLSYFWLVTESPRWLLSRGRISTTKDLLKKIAAFNRKPFPHEMFAKMVTKEVQIQKDEFSDEYNPLRETEASKTDKNKSTEHLLILLKHKLLAIYFGIVMFNWIVNALVYYVLIFNVSNLPGSIYLNFFLINCVDFTGAFIAYFLLDRWGRKITYVSFMSMASFGCLSGIFPILLADKVTAPTIVNVLALIGRAGVATSFGIIYLLSAELFPTTVRNSALGCFSMSGRIGAMVAPYIADVGLIVGGELAQVLPLVICGSAGLGAVISSLFLPEMKGKILPNKILEALEFYKNPQNQGRPAHVKNVSNDSVSRTKDVTEWTV